MTGVQTCALPIYYQVLLKKAFMERKALAAFERGQHEHAIVEFCSLDKSLLGINRSRLAREHWRCMPKTSSGEGQLGVLLWEFQKKSRHLPIRQLMYKAGNVIQAIKPVMMMSPLSIANFIDPESVKFDIVIFDEASQVRPVEAFGAILRGNQAIVVGDSCQMPPTSFFDFISGVNDDEEENCVADVESILGLFVAQNSPQRMLRWHYRSRHESLIAVSNHELYRDKLVIFPSAGNEAVKTAEGYISMEFGPLNREGGERRLNVLITRARHRCEVFTNLTADDIDLNRTSSRGVQCLKTFLSYAKDRRLDIPLETGKEADSTFEEDVYYH